MFLSRYVPLIERERLAQEVLDFRQGTESVTNITKMFMERAMFLPKFAASEQGQMTQYLSRLTTDIRQFMSTQRYGSLVDFQEAVKRREIGMEI